MQKDTAEHTIQNGRLGFTWLRHAHWDEVVEVECACFDRPFRWSVAELGELLEYGNSIGIVAILDGEAVVAHMLHETMPHDIHLMRLAVHPDVAQNGIGRMFMGLLETVTKKRQRPAIRTWVSELHLPAQTFLRHMGFKAERVIRGSGDVGEDMYEFRKDVQC